MYLESVFKGIGNTPLVALKRLSPNKKVCIYVKLEGQNMGGSASVKDRIAYYMLEEAEKMGLLTKDKIILEATSGNTGIALAWLGRLKGYRTKIVMPESMSVERRQILMMYGAELVLTPGKPGMEGAINHAREMLASNSDYFMPDQFTNPANPRAHYETTGPEILNDLPEGKIDIFTLGLGTGGTVTGAGRYLKEKIPELKIHGVEPFTDDPIQGLRNMRDTFVPPVIDLSLLDERVNISCREAIETIRRLLREEGIFCGVSSGAALTQALKAASEMDEGNIVCLLPDGGWKYLSNGYWD
jgi:cysteine synthase B